MSETPPAPRQGRQDPGGEPAPDDPPPRDPAPADPTSASPAPADLPPTDSTSVARAGLTVADPVPPSGLPEGFEPV
ncbi:hypothetical protein ABZW49_48860 [Nonomuraea wenchangensis]